MQREFWAMSKEHIKDELGFDDEALSDMDFAMLLVYAFAVWALCILGDRFDKRIVLTIVHLVCAVVYFLQGLGGHLKIQ